MLELIAAGRSNAEVAHVLLLSEATVKSHVTRLLARLELRDRMQAAIFAYEVGAGRAAARMKPARDDAGIARPTIGT